MEEANAVDLAQATRRMLDERGAPKTAENYNRAMLAILQGRETTDFDAALDRAVTGTRGATGTGRPARRGATYASDEGNVSTQRGDTSRRPSPPPGNTPTVQSKSIENKPPETATAGDSDRDRPVTGKVNLATTDLDPAAGLNLFGDREPGGSKRVPVAGVPTGSQPATVPGTAQVSGSPANDRGVTGGTPAARAGTTTPSSDVTGTPDGGQPANAREAIRRTLEGPGADLVQTLVLGMGGRGFGMRGNPFAAAEGGGLPPGSVNPPGPPMPGLPGKGGLPADPSPTAYRMYPEDSARVVRAGPALLENTPKLPAPPTALPAPSAGLPSPMGPPAPSGPLPPGSIPMQAGPTQARMMGTPRPIGQPRIPHDPYADARAESIALGQELRARAARRGRNVPSVGDTTR